MAQSIEGAAPASEAVAVGDLMGKEVATAVGENLGSPEGFTEVNGETNMVLSGGGFL